MNDKWQSVEDFKKQDRVGWCWIVYNGRVVEAFYVLTGTFRESKHSCHYYEAKFITHVKTWDKPELPIKKENEK